MRKCEGEGHERLSVKIIAGSLDAGDSEFVPVKCRAAGSNASKSTSQIGDCRAGKTETVPERARRGLNVHGHWTIEIRNPGGSLAGRHEFENYLAPVGKKLLTAILTRTGTMMQWDVRLIAGQACLR